MTGGLALQARQEAQESQPYTFRTGDFKMLVRPSLGLDYNDNITLSSSGHDESDFIFKPLLDLTATYPITQRNLLRLRLGVGYDYYFDHDQYSAVRLESGSELSFDMYVKDFWFNFHDRFSYTREPSLEPAVAGTAIYGGFDNFAGLSTTWDLQDLVLTLGYDHENFISASDQYEYMNRASELLLARLGFKINPRLTAGIETTGAFTTYDERILNDNTSYSGGAYADWQPGSYFRVQARAGYAAYLFDQTSRLIRAVDQDAWYASLSATHSVSDAISYTFSAGHELRLGIQADSVEDTYVRPSLTWRILRDLAMTPSLSYEHGTQGAAGQLLKETYDWFVAGLGLRYAITPKLVGSLDYRHTIRGSDASNRDYNQNLVSLRFTYEFR